MALVTGVKFVLTWGIANIMFIIFGVLIKTFAFDNSMWTNARPELLAFADNMYAIWFSQLIIIPTIILITAWREAEYKAAVG